ncbi:Uncharacterised protein [Mycobacteroides abscessus subsp. abscessus]|nr:Uncharacterised protein [Mycobacteroides abscessus subsp. abscessus]SKV11604.1 Uncharacterised protein [Mycobacteroides abscessus subsp. abscessus]
MMVVRTTSHLVAPKASAASIWPLGVWMKTSRVTAAMIGRIITASTMPPVNRLPPPAMFTGLSANSGMKPRFLLSHRATGAIAGAST